jgi:acyl carrier protein
MDQKDKLYIEISEIFNSKKSSVDIDSTIDNSVEWDSLTHIKLMTFLNEKYNIEFSSSNLIKCTSVKGILNILNYE